MRFGVARANNIYISMEYKSQFRIARQRGNDLSFSACLFSQASPQAKKEGKSPGRILTEENICYNDKEYICSPVCRFVDWNDWKSKLVRDCPNYIS